MVGFLTHTGYAHGGNGYEGIAYLNEQFKGSGLNDPSAKQHGIDLQALAAKAVAQYAQYKTQKKAVGSLDIAKLPGVNHPVFKDQPVNHDPREVFIDAVIAALLLKMLWKPLQRGEIGDRDLETAAFTTFLYPRMLGCAAEIGGRLNRGRNMDTRTVASVCKFVA